MASTNKNILISRRELGDKKEFCEDVEKQSDIQGGVEKSGWLYPRASDRIKEASGLSRQLLVGRRQRNGGSNRKR